MEHMKADFRILCLVLSSIFHVYRFHGRKVGVKDRQYTIGRGDVS